jgi:hypothetical protein
MESAIRERLLVATDIEFVPYGTLPRETYKSRLVAHPEDVPGQRVANT